MQAFIWIILIFTILKYIQWVISLVYFTFFMNSLQQNLATFRGSLTDSMLFIGPILLYFYGNHL